MAQRVTRMLLLGMTAAVVAAAPVSARAFDCAQTQCPQIKTCAEARYKLYACGHGERDADNDGIPCEDICGEDIATFEVRSLATWPKGFALRYATRTI